MSSGLSLVASSLAGRATYVREEKREEKEKRENGNRVFSFHG